MSQLQIWQKSLNNCEYQKTILEKQQQALTLQVDIVDSMASKLRYKLEHPLFQALADTLEQENVIFLCTEFLLFDFCTKCSCCFFKELSCFGTSHLYDGFLVSYKLRDSITLSPLRRSVKCKDETDTELLAFINTQFAVHQSRASIWMQGTHTPEKTKSLYLVLTRLDKEAWELRVGNEQPFPNTETIVVLQIFNKGIK